ncbi:phytoene desaturase family protein [Nocardioides sp.]|uniref:phytoene desaturase family protein n=1 Tax=Nocardioides sp. TaxID=35761 RepID=UPI003518B15F
MSRVVVVGGGFGGMAVAARLAKTGHEVTLLERSPDLGGALGSVSEEGFTWDAGASYTLLPAVLRDLFRKTGRPLERELDLEPLDLVREHRFEDDTTLALPTSRAGQLRALDALEPGLGERWAAHVDSFTEDWEVLRQHYFEHPWQRAALPDPVRRRLDSREMLHKRLKKTLKDERLRDLATFPFLAEGHDPRNVPAWMGLVAYLEQRFGTWHVPGGMARIAEVLAARLATRGVTVLRGTPARDVVLREGRAVAVRTDEGDVDADEVVVAVDPRGLPSLAPLVERTMPAIPPVVCHVGLEGDVPDLPHEVVLHGDPLLVVRTGGHAPDGRHAWTIHGRGKIAEDLLRALARHRIDVRAQLVHRVDRSPRELVQQWGSSPLGVLWQGRSTVRARLGPDTPIPHLHTAGAHATPGAGLPFVGLSAALVAERIGPA